MNRKLTQRNVGYKTTGWQELLTYDGKVLTSSQEKRSSIKKIPENYIPSIGDVQNVKPY